MILIISSVDDVSTNYVIDWLLYNNVPFLRITDNDFISIVKIEIVNNKKTNIVFKVKDKVFSLNDFKKIWYRRGWVIYDKAIINEITEKINTLKTPLLRQLNSEIDDLTQFFVKNLENNSLNKLADNKLNKLFVLDIARKNNIKVPETLITTSKKEVILFYKKHKKIITKNSTQGVFVYDKEEILNVYTQLIGDKEIKKMPETFFPTLFQEAIDKKFELRIFFLDNEFYGSAIFSQLDEKTKIDFRNYNFAKPNRTPPYKLNNLDEKKLRNLMNMLNLNSGSIDCIVNDKNDLVFLEVNPIGQFAQVSIPCNYYLEKKIADYLSINK